MLSDHKVSERIQRLAARLVQLLVIGGDARARVRASAAVGAMHTVIVVENLEDGDLVDTLVAAASAVLKSDDTLPGEPRDS